MKRKQFLKVRQFETRFKKSWGSNLMSFGLANMQDRRASVNVEGAGFPAIGATEWKIFLAPDGRGACAGPIGQQTEW
jgi:hypothetical protein